MELSYLKPKISIHAFRIHHDGTLAAAAIHDLQTERFTTLGGDTAQNELEAELAYWQEATK
jgi:hypothetical protein